MKGPATKESAEPGSETEVKRIPLLVDYSHAKGGVKFHLERKWREKGGVDVQKELTDFPHLL